MNSELKKGLIFSAFGRYSVMLIQLLLNMILSRILTPNDFGVVTMVNVFLVFFQMIADMGFGPAIIQNKNLDDKDVQSIYSLSGLIALCLVIIMNVFGGIYFVISDYKISSIFQILSISLFLYCLNIVPQSLILKAKNFKIINFSSVISSIISALVAIILAIFGFGFYSLLMSQVINPFIMFIAFKKYTKKKILVLRLKGKIEKESIMKIWDFSKNQFTFNVLNYFSRNLDSIMIGSFMSASLLGYYDKAYQLVLKPNQLLNSVLNPVVQPILSEYENNKKIIYDFFKNVSIFMANIGFSISVFIFLSSKEIILIMFGSEWGPSVIPLKILSLSIGFQMISSSTGAIFQSLNRTDILLKSGLYSSCVNISAIITGVLFKDINILSLCLSIAFLLNSVIGSFLITKISSHSRYSNYISLLFKPLIVSFIQIIPIIFVSNRVENIFLLLALKILIFCLSFLVGLFITGQINIFWKLLKKN